jgi:FkbM family methyltransferase
MRKFLKKIAAHWRRIRNANRLGISFTRRAAFQIPARVKLGSRFVDVHSNGEHGARIDFLMCLVEDGYGLEELRETPTTVLDIGANQGFFALAARSFFPDATIHCYEPNQRILSILEKNAEAVRAEVFREAVGSSEGTVFLEESGDSNQARTTSVAGGTAVAQVSLRTVVERLGGKVDLAKIDCEGAEWKMFGDPEPWKAIRNLRMEYHLLDVHHFGEVASSLNAFGFEIFHHEPSIGFGTIWAQRNSCRRILKPTPLKQPDHFHL